MCRSLSLDEYNSKDEWNLLQETMPFYDRYHRQTVNRIIWVRYKYQFLRVEFCDCEHTATSLRSEIFLDATSLDLRDYLTI